MWKPEWGSDMNNGRDARDVVKMPVLYCSIHYWYSTGRGDGAGDQGCVNQ